MAGRLSWRVQPDGKVLLRYPAMAGQAWVTGYSPSGELVVREILPAGSRERAISRGGINRVCYFTLQTR